MRQGRCPLMIEALQRLVEGLRGRAFVVACFDQYPFSLACALMGMQQMMTSVIEDPPLVTALMERCSEYTRAYAVALARAGADMLSGGDSPAGLLGPQLYREFALPAEQRVIAAIREETSVPDFAAHLRECAADTGRHVSIGRRRVGTGSESGSGSSLFDRGSGHRAVGQLGSRVGVWPAGTVNK